MMVMPSSKASLADCWMMVTPSTWVEEPFKSYTHRGILPDTSASGKIKKVICIAVTWFMKEPCLQTILLLIRRAI